MNVSTEKLENLAMKLLACEDVSCTQPIKPLYRDFLLYLCRNGGEYEGSKKTLREILGVNMTCLQDCILELRWNTFISLVSMGGARYHIKLYDLWHDLDTLSIENLSKVLSGLYAPGASTSISARSQKVLDLRDSGMTYEEIGKILEVTKMRVFQIFHRNQRRRNVKTYKRRLLIEDLIYKVHCLLLEVPPSWEPCFGSLVG